LRPRLPTELAADFSETEKNKIISENCLAKNEKKSSPSKTIDAVKFLLTQQCSIETKLKFYRLKIIQNSKVNNIVTK
jgi:hypothetical protein